MASVKEVYFMCPVCKELVPLEDVEYREIAVDEWIFNLSYDDYYGGLKYDVDDHNLVEITEKYFVHKDHIIEVPFGVDPEDYLVVVYDDGTVEVGSEVKDIFNEKLLRRKE